jgi:hypothetical protein
VNKDITLRKKSAINFNLEKGSFQKKKASGQEA